MPDDMRPVEITRDYLPNAEGSVLFKLGETKIICAATVEQKVPAWLRGSGRGWITAEYSMLPRATTTRTTREVSRGRPGGRTHEIQRLIGRTLRSVVDLNQLGGETMITLDCDVINADGGTRTAAITGAYIALFDALRHMKEDGLVKEIVCTDFMAAISVGMIDGQPCVDLCFSEDSRADVDMNIVMDSTGKIIEIQGTAEKKPFSRESLGDMLDLAKASIDELIDIQRKTLLAPPG